jgi:Photosynthesis system II assembly factor YCF48
MFRLAAAFFVLGVLAMADQRWDLQYRYRQIDSTLTINDLAFPSDKRGIACGYTTDSKEKDHPLVLLTSDGGKNWTESVVKETGIALFFLDDSTGWMITEKGIWTTAESGRSWTKLNKAPAGMLRVWFLDRQHGFAAGLQKRVFETKDGGASWELLDILKEVQGNVAFTTFGEIAFAGDKGIISGWNIPPRRGGPDWMETDNASMRIQVPHYSVLLETLDGGKKWIKSEASVFGVVSRISLTTQGTGLGLIEFKENFEYPSEVERINMHTGKSERSFRQKDRAITDVRLFGGSNTAVLAGYETAGTGVRSPIPGKVKVLTSSDLENWTEMPVDYRAVAHATIIAGPDEKNLWIATDTGMILKLVTE